MTTITITLEDELAARLRERAQNLGVAPEDWAREKLQSELDEEIEQPDVTEITTRVFARRKSAYEKLAEGAP
jgi:plasmid stability protein